LLALVGGIGMAAELPLNRVVLFSSGVGFFEHVGMQFTQVPIVLAGQSGAVARSSFSGAGSTWSACWTSR